MATLKHIGTPFSLWGGCEVVPEPLEKAGLDGSEAPKRWILKGFVSHEAVDADGQIVCQDGIDWSLFDQRGMLMTKGHPYDQSRIVGSAYLRESRTVAGVKGTWLECELNPELPLAPGLWDMHRALCKGPSGRGLGFSVEGWAKEIRGNQIVKSLVATVAIDALPKNPMTYALAPIAASLGAYLGAGGSTDVNFPALMKALALASDPDVRAKLELIDGQSIAHLAALRIASRYPDRTFAEALALAKSIPGVSL